MDPMTLQLLLGAASAVAGWWAKHFLAPGGSTPAPVSPVVPASPGIDPALAAVLALLEKALEDRLKRGAP